MTLESAVIASDVGWAWWEAGQVLDAADLERKRGDLAAAERHARRSLELGLELGDRRVIVFSTAELAIIAADGADAARAGLLWGAVETEARAGRVGQWEANVERLEALVMRVEGPAFSEARAVGRLLNVSQAVGLESA